MEYRLENHLDTVIDYVESLEAFASGDILTETTDGRFDQLEALFGTKNAAYSDAEKLILLGLVFITGFPATAAARFAIRKFRTANSIQDRIKSWKSEFAEFGCRW